MTEKNNKDVGRPWKYTDDLIMSSLVLSYILAPKIGIIQPPEYMIVGVMVYAGGKRILEGIKSILTD